MVNILITLLLFAASIISGCATQDLRKDNATVTADITAFVSSDQVEDAIVIAPDNISESLIPDLDLSLKPTKNIEEDRFDISIDNVDAREFFMGLVVDTKYSMVVSPKINEKISLTLKNVNIAEALAAAQDAYGYEYQSTSYGYKVFPAGLITKTFQVDYLNIKRIGTSNTSVAAGQLTSGGSGDTSSNQRDQSLNASVGTETTVDFWPELATTIKNMIGEQGGRSIVVSPQTGLIVVKAMPDELQEVAKYLDKAERSLNRQVIIEAKIVEVELYDDYQAGIDWSFLENENSSAINKALSDSGFAGNVDLSDFTSIFTVKHSLGKFSTLVKLLSTQGYVQVLSSPRVATVNNQKAIIKVGRDEFFVTDVSGNVGQNASSATNTQSQSIELTPFFSGISLDVTPHINRKGQVILHIHPIVSDVIDKSKSVKVQGQDSTLPSALSSIRESDNIVKAKNGQVVIIGGLMQTKIQEDLGKTPIAGDVPVVGNLFNRTGQRVKKSELVIMLKPIIANDDVWLKEVSTVNNRVNQVNKGFNFRSIKKSSKTN